MSDLTPEQLAQLDLEAGFPSQDVAQMVAIQLNQSGGNPNVVGWDYQGQTVADTQGTNEYSGAWSSYDTGLSQINSVHDPNNSGEGAIYDPAWISEMEDPLLNAKEALSLYDSSGWGPWEGDPSLGSNETNFSVGEAAVNAAEGKTVQSVWGGTATGAPSSSASTSSSSSANTNPNSPSSTTEYGSLSGLAALLQDLDQLLNPTVNGSSTSGLSGFDVLFAGLSAAKTAEATFQQDILAMVQLLVIRGLFTVLFIGVTYLGIKSITSSGGTSVNIVEMAQRQARSAQSQARITLSQQESERKSQASQAYEARRAAEREAASERQTSDQAEARRRRSAYTRAFNSYVKAGGDPNRFQPPK